MLVFLFSLIGLCLTNGATARISDNIFLREWRHLSVWMGCCSLMYIHFYFINTRSQYQYINNKNINPRVSGTCGCGWAVAVLHHEPSGLQMRPTQLHHNNTIQFHTNKTFSHQKYILYQNYNSIQKNTFPYNKCNFIPKTQLHTKTCTSCHISSFRCTSTQLHHNHICFPLTDFLVGTFKVYQYYFSIQSF